MSIFTTVLNFFKKKEEPKIKPQTVSKKYTKELTRIKSLNNTKGKNNNSTTSDLDMLSSSPTNIYYHSLYSDDSTYSSHNSCNDHSSSYDYSSSCDSSSSSNYD